MYVKFKSRVSKKGAISQKDKNVSSGNNIEIIKIRTKHSIHRIKK